MFARFPRTLNKILFHVSSLRIASTGIGPVSGEPERHCSKKRVTDGWCFQNNRADHQIRFRQADLGNHYRIGATVA
ncbi:MAG TPA: hypothetical protein VJU54_07370, partial [Nitrospiraceae bacterium]|nr:hypothetical protein [Nitrospiraceae bacterium]